MKTIKSISYLFLGVALIACSSSTYKETVSKVNMDRFMGDWYVIAGRFTYFEKDAYNAIEKYRWNEKEQRIDISFEFNKGSINGPKDDISQKGWVINKNTNATWEVSPFWPLRFGYLVIDLDPDYQWTAIGVPDQAYLWIMSRTPHMPKDNVEAILQSLKLKGYDTTEIKYMVHE